MLVARVKAACLALLVAAPVLGHVAPDRDLNNRYLKVTLLPEGVRVTFTLLYGYRPAVTERRRIDENGDGRLEAAEADAFGRRLAAELAPRLVVILDGERVDPWRLTDVGLGNPVTSGGPFSVDLELRATYRDPGAAEHVLEVDDQSAVPLAGEVELRIDESPGVRVLASHLKEQRGGIELAYTFAGNGRAPGDRAVVVRIGVDAAARPRPARAPLAALAAAIALVAVGAAWLARRRRAAT